MWGCTADEKNSQSSGNCPVFVLLSSCDADYGIPLFIYDTQLVSEWQNYFDAFWGIYWPDQTRGLVCVYIPVCGKYRLVCALWHVSAIYGDIENARAHSSLWVSVLPFDRDTAVCVRNWVLGAGRPGFEYAWRVDWGSGGAFHIFQISSYSFVTVSDALTSKSIRLREVIIEKLSLDILLTWCILLFVW